MKKHGICCFAVLLLTSFGTAQWTPRNPVQHFERRPDGVVLALQSGTLRIQVCTPSVIHVLYSQTSTFPAQREFVVIKSDWPSTDWSLDSNQDEITISTKALRLVVARVDG